MLLRPRLDTDVAIVHIVVDVVIDLLLNCVEIQWMLALVGYYVSTSVVTFVIIVCSADAGPIVKGTI